MPPKVKKISRLPYLKNLLKRGVEDANKKDLQEPKLKLPEEKK